METQSWSAFGTRLSRERYVALVRKAKERIKELAQRQHDERRALKEAQRRGERTATAQSQLFSRAVEVTALLNVYNELRGRTYRHGVPENARGQYALYLGRTEDWIREQAGPQT